ncbi:MAG: SurA N-terminal domain-containing protein [Pseudomonadota bacterium]
MLQNIRDNARGVGAIIMLGLLIIAFAIWGIDFQFGANQPVVTVNGKEVSNNLIANAYQQQIQRFQEFYPNGIPDVAQEELKQNVIDSFVRSELLNQHVVEQGYALSNASVMDAIRDLPAFQLDGKFSTTQFDFRARTAGMTQDGLFNEFRDSMLLQQLSNGFVNSSFITPAEAMLRGRLESEQRTIRELRVPVSTLISTVTLDDNAIADDYEFNNDDYLTEEMVRIDYIELDPAKLGERVDISDEALQQRYEQGVDADEYSSPEQRNARHILVAINDDRDDETARSEASALRDRILAGEEFASLASEYSDDAGSKPAGGELGWNNGEGYVGPFRDALFSMTEDQISEPIKTRFGYHIIKVEGIRGNEPKPFEDVRDQIEAELRNDAALDRLSELVIELDELVYDIDDSLTTAAEEAEVEVQQLPWFTRASGTGIATYPEVRDAAFSEQVLNDRLNSTSINLDGKIVYLRLNDHRPSRTMTLEEVSPRIEMRLRREAASQQALVLGNDLLAKLNSGSSIDTVAGEVDLSAGELKTVARLEQSLPIEARNELFATDYEEGRYSYGGVALPNGDFFLFELHGVETGEPLNAAAAQDVARANANSELAAYIASLREAADVEVRPDQLITR